MGKILLLGILMRVLSILYTVWKAKIFFGLAGFYDGKQSETSLGGKTNSWLIYDLESYSSCRLVSNIHCNDAISQESLLFNTPDHRDRRRRDGYTLVES